VHVTAAVGVASNDFQKCEGSEMNKSGLKMPSFTHNSYQYKGHDSIG